jgi:hypothetical protein
MIRRQLLHTPSFIRWFSEIGLANEAPENPFQDLIKVHASAPVYLRPCFRWVVIAPKFS